jgi:hypothetical protein
MKTPGSEDGLLPLSRVAIVTGNYGSGKTEVSVNWVLHLARIGVPDLTIADLDIVNPYFRCREAGELMTAAGVRVIAPPGEQLHAELPILLPEIKGALQRPDGIALLDVGGDDVGARVLASYAGFFGAHEMLQVVNANRPFTDTVAGARRIAEEIEASSRLRMTGVISNAHLQDETTVDGIVKGAELARRVAEVRGLPLRFVTAPRELMAEVAARIPEPVLPIDRRMLPPWKRTGTTTTRGQDRWQALTEAWKPDPNG